MRERIDKGATPLFIPVLIMLILLGCVGYYVYLNNKDRRLTEEINSLKLAVEEKRRVLRSLEELERVRRTPLVSVISRWVHTFEDPLEARIRTEGRLREVLATLKTRDAQVRWIDSWETNGARQGLVKVSALVPSYEALIQVLRAVEGGTMPMILRSLQAKKEGMRIRVELEALVFFRVEHGAL